MIKDVGVVGMGLLQADVFGDDGLKDQIAEVFSQLALHILRHVGPLGEGTQHAQDLQVWVQLGLLHHVHGFLQLHQPRQGEETGGDGDKQTIAGDEGVNRQ